MQFPGEQILKTMEGKDNLEMKVLAEARHAKDEAEHEHHHHHDHDEHEHEGHDHHHDHDEHEEHDHHHDHDDPMDIIMSMVQTAHVDATIMTMRDTIMQMMYLRAGERKHLINLTGMSLKKS